MELEEDRIRGIVARLAHLRDAYGEVLAEPELVEPTGAFFPDEFKLEPESIANLLRRMLGYAPLAEDLDVGLAFQEGAAEGGSCGTGGCSTGGPKAIARGGATIVHEVDATDPAEGRSGYAAVINVADVGDPTILTTTLARAIGRIVLFEAGEDVDPRNEGAESELTALASGLGLLLFNGACVYKKGCGGVKRHQATFLELEELALGLALFLRVHGKKPAAVRRHLEVTQREAFDAALAWVDGQPTLVESLRERPETLTDGVFDFERPKGLLSRFFAKKTEAPKPRAARSEEELRRLAEAKALVEAALE